MRATQEKHVQLENLAIMGYLSGECSVHNTVFAAATPVPSIAANMLVLMLTMCPAHLIVGVRLVLEQQSHHEQVHPEISREKRVRCEKQHNSPLPASLADVLVPLH